MLRHERVVGLISSSDIRWKESSGYSLLITDLRVVGARRAPLADDYWAYFPLDGKYDPALADEAEKKGGEIVASKNFEFQRADVVKIIYEPPRLFSGGRVLFSTVGRRVQLEITVLSGWNPGILKTLQILVDSLLTFDPQVLFDERTGSRLSDEVTKLVTG